MRRYEKRYEIPDQPYFDQTGIILAESLFNDTYWNLGVYVCVCIILWISSVVLLYNGFGTN